MDGGSLTHCPRDSGLHSPAAGWAHRSAKNGSFSLPSWKGCSASMEMKRLTLAHQRPDPALESLGNFGT